MTIQKEIAEYATKHLKSQKKIENIDKHSDERYQINMLDDKKSDERDQIDRNTAETLNTDI